jgi:hypothetical protein
MLIYVQFGYKIEQKGIIWRGGESIHERGDIRTKNRTG